MKNSPQLIEAAKAIAKELNPTYKPSQHGDMSPEAYVEHCLEGYDLARAIVDIAVEGYKRGDAETWEHIIHVILSQTKVEAIQEFVRGVANE